MNDARCAVCGNLIEVDPAALHAWLTGKLPKFMVPRYIQVGALPRNATTQRIKKFELRAAGVSSTTWDAEER